MNLVDTNVWVALFLSGHPFHHSARTWYATQSKRKSAIVCRCTQQSLLRLLTTEKFMAPYGVPAMTNAEAWELIENNLADPRCVFLPEPPSLDVHWRRLATRNTASPKLWMDAYLAAFAIAGEYRLITADRAFAQFKDLDHLLLTPGVAR